MTTKTRSSDWWVYIVECADGSFYTGSSNNIERRVKTHNAGRGARYTRDHSPVRLVYSEPCLGRGGALKRELSVKKLSHWKKKALIEQFLLT